MCFLRFLFCLFCFSAYGSIFDIDENDITSEPVESSIFDAVEQKLDGKLSDTKKIEIVIIDKMQGGSKRFVAKSGNTLFVEDLKIDVRRCEFSYELGASCFLDVRKERVGEESQVIFFGWIFSSAYSLSKLESPLYEILICY